MDELVLPMASFSVATARSDQEGRSSNPDVAGKAQVYLTEMVSIKEPPVYLSSVPGNVVGTGENPWTPDKPARRVGRSYLEHSKSHL